MWCLYVVTQTAVKYVTAGGRVDLKADWVSCCVFLGTVLLLRTMLPGPVMRKRWEAWWGVTKAYTIERLKGVVHRNKKLVDRKKKLARQKIVAATQHANLMT